jgi:hypothetical protein
MARRRFQNHVIFRHQFFRRKLRTCVDIEPKKFDNITDGLGKDEFFAFRYDRNRLGAEALKKR